MPHHANPYRPFPSDGIFGHVIGPTAEGNKPTASDIYAAVDGGGGVFTAVGVTRTVQPFDKSLTEATTTAFKSPGGLAFAASMGFPFTHAQWKELERQAMIYKYMMSSIPVPPHLLIPTFRNLPTRPIVSHSPSGSSLNLRFTNGADLEPGRCRRTDGKKWRCSRDAAPDQKYCESHLHRGRPRSRKPVELNANINNSNKKTRYNPAAPAESPFSAAILNPNINTDGAASQCVRVISKPYLQNPAFLGKSRDKVAALDANATFVSTCKGSRGTDWMMKEGSIPIAAADQQWHNLVQTEIGPATETSFNNVSVLHQHCQEPFNLNSFGNFNGGQDRTLFLNETPRGFIDLWSNGASDDPAASSRNTSSVPSNGKLTLSSLTLSMGGYNSIDDVTEMGLGLIKSDKNHECGANITPGGPLAEVIQLSTVNTSGNLSSSETENGESGSSPATAVSSPSGVLQKRIRSFSESSGNDSPTLASSKAKPEVGLVWLNQGKLE